MFKHINIDLSALANGHYLHPQFFFLPLETFFFVVVIQLSEAIEQKSLRKIMLRNDFS